MSTTKTQLIEKLQSRHAQIGIVGLGYVGLPLALRFVNAGYSVSGFDIDAGKPANINAGKSYISHIPDQHIADAVKAGLSATTDFVKIASMDAIILCVPTPLNPDNSPDLSFVINTVETICRYLQAGQVVALESTTYPGTTEEELLPRMSKTGLTVGEDIFLVYSPEREDPGNPNFDTQTIPKICGGLTAHCLEVGLALYGGAIDELVPVSSLKVAEMAKLLENIYRAVNIGMINEMKMVADKMEINIHEVIRAAATKPFGFTAFYPGPGLGGHCLPIDPFYLSWKAQQCGAECNFIRLSGEVNQNMPAYVVEKILSGLARLKVKPENASVLVMGIAYKKNIDDMRESPAVEIMQQLANLSITIAYSDPYVPTFPRMRHYQFNLQSLPASIENIAAHDAVIIATDHDSFDYDLIAQHAKIIIDTRGRYAMDNRHNVIQA